MRRSGAHLATCLHHFASFCILTRFPNFSEFSVAVPRIGTGSEVGLCVDAAEKLDKKALRNPGRYVNRQFKTAWRTFTDSTDRTR